MGSQCLLHLGAVSVRLSEGSLVLMAACSVRYNCNTIIVSCSCEFCPKLSYVHCPVVREA